MMPETVQGWPGVDGQVRRTHGGAAPQRTTVIVTHDKDLLRRLSPRVVMLNEAKICFDGPYEKFGGPDCLPAADYLREMPVLHARPA